MAREQVYSQETLEVRLAQDLPSWFLDQGQLCRDIKTAHWKASLMVANVIGYLAEAAWHHPDLVVTWGGVQVRLSTHSAGGITAKDLELAGEIERTVTWVPAADSALEGTPADAKWRILAPA